MRKGLLPCDVGKRRRKRGSNSFFMGEHVSCPPAFLSTVEEREGAAFLSGTAEVRGEVDVCTLAKLLSNFLCPELKP